MVTVISGSGAVIEIEAPVEIEHKLHKSIRGLHARKFAELLATVRSSPLIPINPLTFDYRGEFWYDPSPL